ncbi:Peptidase C1A papain C-terminal domain-containing protein [Entamoeba marina]
MYVIIPPVTKDDINEINKEVIDKGTQDVLDIISSSNNLGYRSACWGFSSIFQLEYSYNKLLENQYVSFNEQSYMIDAILSCEDANYEGCPMKKFSNTTNTGYPQWLWQYTSLANKVIPNSVCPYQTDSENEWKCDGKDKAQEKNPIKFNVNAIRTYRSISELKSAVKNGPLSMIVPTYNGEHVMTSNTDPILKKLPSARVAQCPDSSDECVYIPNEHISADGEYIMTDKAVNRAGYHVVTIVGYNDEYLAKDNTKGAFIVRDSLPEREKYGSHSAQFLSGKYSEWDERTLCANVYNPMNWDSCVNMNPGPTGDAVKKDIRATCLNDDYITDNVNNTRKPIEFECFDETICSSTSERYFLINTSRSDDTSYLFSTCFLKVNPSNTDEQTEECFVDIPIGAYNKFIRPIESQITLLTKDTTFCGYRSLPYSYLDSVTMVKAYDTYYGVQFDIDWDSTSYVSDSNSFDYTTLEANIHSMPEFKGFIGPEPYQVRYDY